MSTSHEQGAVFYVVSRSGKVLGSEDYTGTILEGDYYEEELEGWIFWGSEKRWTSHHGFGRLLDGTASTSGSDGRSFLGNQLDNLGTVSWTSKIPSVVWGDETDSQMYRRQTRLHGKKFSVRGPIHRSWSAQRGVTVESICGASFPGYVDPHMAFHAERWYHTEKNFKIGFSQLAVLRKWEPGSRELAARWAAWLLKMLRKSRPRHLQHLLFTMCAAVLPVICYSLVRQQWASVLDQELCRCVDIVWNALDKSNACFSPAQWEILEEKLIECKELRAKVGSLAKEYPQQEGSTDILESSQHQVRSRPNIEMRTTNRYVTLDEQSSNALIQSEGIPALVRRALQEKIFVPQSRSLGETEVAGDFGSSGTIVSLMCPLSGKRIKVPARARGCSHLTTFDLQTYLEGHAKSDQEKCSSSHQQKKLRMEAGRWCCPICESDATWPQLLVDKLLLRILEVLPEHMPEVCLLPNGRWRVVQRTGGKDPSKMESISSEIGRDSHFNFPMSNDIYHIGLFGELSLDARKPGSVSQDHSRGFDALQFLNRAYSSWKDGMDVATNVSTGQQFEVHCDEESTQAVWHGPRGQRPSTDFWGQPSHERMLYLQEVTDHDGRQETHSTISLKRETYPQLCDGKVNLSEAGNWATTGMDSFELNDASEGNEMVECDTVGEKYRVEEDVTKRASGRSTPGRRALGTLPVRDKRWCVYKRKLKGQTKARPKLMAKKA